MGRIYQQTFIDTYAKVAQAKLYDRKNALVAADMLNERGIPFYEEQGVRLLRLLTDRGTEYCGAREHHEYQLYLALEDIDHTRTKTRHPQTKDYASYCTSWALRGTSSVAGRLFDSLTPIAFRGGLAPGCSYKQSFLPL